MSDDNKEKRRPNANYKMSDDATEKKRPNADHKTSDDTDDAKGKRPNANYKLSNENTEGKEIVHHYNRERRLEKAPQAVRDMYTEQPRRRLGFFFSLLGTKPNRMLFGTIVLLCLMMIMLSIFGFTGDSRELDGNILSVKAKKHEGTIIVEVRKTPRKDKIAQHMNAYTGAVDLAVFPTAKKGQDPSQLATNVFYHRIYFTNDQVENYLFTVPFEQSELSFIFRTEKKSLNLTIGIRD